MPFALVSRRWLFRVLLMASITALAVAALATARRADPIKPVSANVMQKDLAVKLGKYMGTVEFEDRDHNKFKGAAELEVKDQRRFTLKYNGREYQGNLVTLISGGKPGGNITFDGAQEISIV